MKKSTTRILAVNTGFVFLFFVLLESTLHLCITHPALIPRFCLATFRKYCNEWDRNIIQFNPAYARYDSLLYYTLRPGTFVFSNREYQVTFEVNSAGLRDSENALDHPKVISLGDSFAMGWGVEQDQTYAEGIAAKTGLKVLNAGISSFGTAREIALLERLQTDSLRFLVFQYCSNDYDENSSVDSSGKLNISSPASYRDLCMKHIESIAYFPFKHTLKMASIIHRKVFPSNHPYSEDPLPAAELDERNKSESAAFLRVLSHIQLPHSVQILVLSLDNYESTSGFTRALTMALSTGQWQEDGKKLTVLDVSPVIDASDYYPLDGHLNAKGHEKIAVMLTRVILGAGEQARFSPK